MKNTNTKDHKMAQLRQQQDWSHMCQVFQFNVANNFTVPGVRVTWLLCYFVNKLTYIEM